MTRNRHLFTLYGLDQPDPQEAMKDPAGVSKSFLNAIHPQDADLVRRKFLAATEGVDNGAYDLTYRVVHAKTGNIVTLRSHVETHVNPDESTSLIAIVQDISMICRMQQEEVAQKVKTDQLKTMLAAVSIIKDSVQLSLL
jgi:PAS fold